LALTTSQMYVNVRNDDAVTEKKSNNFVVVTEIPFDNVVLL